MTVATLMVMVSIKGVSNPAADTNTASDRFVSTFTGADEVLWQLLHGADRSRILSLSAFAKLPAYSNICDSIPKDVMTGLASNPELLVKRQPSLVISANFNRPTLRAAYERLGIPVLTVTDFSSIEDIKKLVMDIAKAIRRRKSGELLIADMDNKLDRAPRFKFSVSAVNYHPRRTIMGENTIFDDVLKHLQITNTASQIGVKGWQQVNPEQLVRSKPDFIIVPIHDQSRSELIRTIKKDPVWGLLAASRANRFVFVPSAALHAVSHHITEAIESISTQVQQHSHEYSMTAKDRSFAQ